MSESKSCVNCQEEVVGAYCHNCGQKYGVVRLTWRTMFDDLQKRLFGFDNNFVRTVRDLTLRPHIVVRSILDGVRVIYIGPVGFYFLMLTVYLLTASMLDIDLTEMMRASSESINGDQEVSAGQEQLLETMFNAMANNFRIFSFLMVPLFVLSNKIFFRKAKMNFVEHSVVVFYGSGWPFLFTTTTLVLYAILASYPSMLVSAVAIMYYSWICANVYTENKILGVIKGALSWLLAYLFFMILIVIGLFIYMALNPELAKSFVTPN